MKKIAKEILKAGLPVPFIVKPVIRGLYKLGVVICEGMIFLKKFFFVEPVFRSVAQVGRGLRIERLPYMRGKGKLIIGDNVYISGLITVTFMNRKEANNSSQEGREEREGEREPVVRIGDNTFIGHGCSISCASSITIGREVLISSGTKILDNDGHPHDAEKRRAGGKIGADEIAPVVIEDGAWIGTRSIILKGAHIKENEIVGAGTVLRR